MARVAVVMYRCDSCKTTGEPEKPPEGIRIPPRLIRDAVPEGWVELKAVGNRGLSLSMHLCDKCLLEASRLLLGMSLDSKDIEEHGVKPLIDDPDHTKKED
jgi:hypothetical protein